MGVGVQSLTLFVSNEFANACVVRVLDGCFTELDFKFKFEIVKARTAVLKSTL